MLEAKQIKATQFLLKLENGETVVCSKSGDGRKIAFIPGGPGSFYFKGLAALNDEYTFFACDANWTYRKPYGQFFAEKVPATVTRESIKQRDHWIINALKKQLAIDQIDGFAFSAPGAFLFEEALDYPNDYHNLIGTGVGVTELDPTFAKTNALFFDRATPERQAIFRQHQARYQQLQSAVEQGDVSDKKLLKFFNFKLDGKAAVKFKSKPHKRFVAETMAMATKLFFDYADMEIVRLKLLEHWQHNPFGEHVDKRFQKHFFTQLYPQLKPLQTMIALAKTGKHILLIYGETDFVTPLTPEIVKLLQEHPCITIIILDKCGHVPYMEAPDKYSQVVMDFVNRDKPVIIPAADGVGTSLLRSRL